MRDTPYATEVRQPGRIQFPSGTEGRIERIFIKQKGGEEIRFSWWKDGKLIPRPLDLTEDELVALFQDAIANNVLTDRCRESLRALL